jgi:hypothetical protein
MSLECSDCERVIYAGHDPECSRWTPPPPECQCADPTTPFCDYHDPM